jgi:hypothetical protein
MIEIDWNILSLTHGVTDLNGQTVLEKALTKDWQTP